MRYIPLTLLLLIVLTAILSWVGSVYAWGLNSLLDAEGLRWLLTHVLENFRVSPWVELVLGLSALSILVESGLTQVFTPRFWRRNHRSLKKIRALQVTTVCFVFFVLCALYFVLSPSSPLLSAFGRFSQSPLYYGAYAFVLFLLTLLAVIYGFTSGRFLSFADVVQALVYLPSTIAGWFVTLFLASQFMACLHYVIGASLPTLGQLLTDGAPNTMVVSTSTEFLLFIVVYGIPLLISVLKIYIKCKI